MWESRKRFIVKRCFNQGFTLIELLVSLGLVAVLSAGVISIVGAGSRQYARDVRRQSDIEAVASALGIYRNDVGNYPECPGAAASCNITAMVPAITTLYLPAYPPDPSGRAYTYKPMTTGGAACDNPGTRCARFVVCASSEKPVTADALCSGLTCGGTNACIFAAQSQ